MHYFAYGNLLDKELMQKLAPSARPVSVARLDGYELGFAACAKDPETGGCTLNPREGASMWGVNYELSDEDMAALDEAAHVPDNWQHIEVSITDQHGKTIQSTTYHIAEPSGAFSPADSYVAPIFKGAENLSLPDAYQARLREIVTQAQQ